MVKILGSAAAAGLMALALGTSGASATPITVTNFSFENTNSAASPGNTLASGGFVSGCPIAWTCTGTSMGVYWPVNTQFPAGVNGLASSPPFVPDGTNAAVTFGSALQVMEQNVGSIAANTTYLLKVWLGDRNDMGDAWTTGGQTPTIELWAAGVLIPGALTVTTDPGAGKWKQFSLSWDSALIPADVGKTLGFALLVPTNTSAFQVAWDDVTLDATVDPGTPNGGGRVPEPFTLSLIFGAGLAGAAALRRRRKA